jgi:signal transduction histidine kinase
VLVAVGLTVNVLAVGGYARAAVTPRIRAELPDWGMSPSGYAAVEVGVAVALMLVYLVVAAIVYLRAPTDVMALYCAYSLAGFASGVCGPSVGVVDQPTVLGDAAFVLFALGQLSLGLFFFVFPSGRIVPRVLRWPALACVIAVGAGLVVGLSGPRGVALGVIQTIGLLLVLVAAIAQVYRYRRVSGPVARQQTKWVVYGLVACVALLFGSRPVAYLFPESMRHSETGAQLIGGGAVYVALAVVPVFIGIAIRRARLWDIDHLISRTLVFASLTASVVLIYVLVVGYLGAALRSETRPWMSLVATGIVAVAFHPLRTRLQRVVNRLMYGQRDEPYTVIAHLGARLEATLRTDAVLPAVVQTLAHALKLPYVEIVLDDDRARHGTPTADPVEVPLLAGDTPVGRLLLGRRRPGEEFTPADLRLLKDLTRQIGTAAHTVTLTSELQRSRERLVTAREEERRRLRRDLHDGLGPTLAGLALKAGSIADQARADPAAAGRTGDELYHEIRAAIAEIRRLVYQLRPPSLDELGLRGALEEVARRQGRAGELDISVQVPGGTGVLSAAAEVAAYRIASEAITNVARHARARTATLTLCHAGDVLELDIRDDGVGLPDGQPHGVGLIAMRERAEELGGTFAIESTPEAGTRIRVRLPARPAAGPERSSALESV